MDDAQACVKLFHKTFGCHIGDGKPPRVADAEMRCRLLREECKELCEALEANDLIGTIDGVCDLLYVTLGTAVACGFDVEKFFYEVHDSNMDKVGGGRDAGGKILKPDGWKPPNIKGILRIDYGVK